MIRRTIGGVLLAGLMTWAAGCDKPAVTTSTTAPAEPKPVPARTDTPSAAEATPPAAAPVVPDAPAETPAAQPAAAPADGAAAAPSEPAPIEQPVAAANVTEPGANESAAAAPAAVDAGPTPSANPDVPVSGGWRGTLKCVSQQSTKASKTAAPKTNSINEQRTFEFVCDESGKPVAMTVLAFGTGQDERIQIGEPGSASTIQQDSPLGQLVVGVTIDTVSFTKDSAEVSVSLNLTLDGNNVTHNGTGSQVVKVTAANGALKTEVQTDYAVTLTVAAIGTEIEVGESIRGDGDLAH